MKADMNTEKADALEELIRGEKEEAERRFDDHRFDVRLFDRICRAEEGRSTGLLVWLTKPGPALAILALFLVISGFLLFRMLSPSPPPQTGRAISAIFDRAGGGLRNIELDGLAQKIATAEYTDLGWALKRVFYACERRALKDVSITDAISLAFLEKDSGDAFSRRGENAAFPRMESPKLRTGEDFQIFFSGFLKRLEEV
jgi:hypothetical protein